MGAGARRKHRFFFFDFDGRRCGTSKEKISFIFFVAVRSTSFSEMMPPAPPDADGAFSATQPIIYVNGSRHVLPPGRGGATLLQYLRGEKERKRERERKRGSMPLSLSKRKPSRSLTLTFFFLDLNQQQLPKPR